jgi:hypothetical protein
MEMEMRLHQPQHVESEEEESEDQQEIVRVTDGEQKHQKNETYKVSTHFSGHDVDPAFATKLPPHPQL